MTTRHGRLLARGDGAVLYLRVSSEDQVGTDYDSEGISIPAQRKACLNLAQRLGVTVVREFVDPARSARSLERRPAFTEMIRYLRAHDGVGFVIVYALSRLARNRYDDAIVMVALEGLRVRLVSATEEHLDESPAGRALHGMIAVFNEYQVLLAAGDVSYKMRQKVSTGGTVGPAKLGYRNVTHEIDGRRVRGIALDPARAPHVREAFQLFASGNRDLEELRDELARAGLRTRGNGRHRSGPCFRQAPSGHAPRPLLPRTGGPERRRVPGAARALG